MTSDETTTKTAGTGPSCSGGGVSARLSGLNVLALCWMAGTWLGYTGIDYVMWLGAACVVVVVMGVCAWRGRVVVAARRWAWVGVVVVAGAWTGVHEQRVSNDSVMRYVGGESQLAEVTGRVDGRPYVTDPRRGEFGRFSYLSPGTVFGLRVETVVVDGERVRASGRLMVRVRETDHRLRVGDEIGARGWLAKIDGPANPGEFDYKRYLSDRGVVGRLTLAARGNWWLMERGSVGWLGSIGRWRAVAADAAVASLRVGMGRDAVRGAFLDRILLGRRGGKIDELEEGFRRVGLAHLLSISGAHLGVLLGLVWYGSRLFVGNPRWSAVIVLVVLAFYLMAAEARVPIVRASIMAGLFGVCYAAGRPMRALDAMSLAVVVVLIWRPGDLFSAGFGLSFGVVAGLLVFTGSMSEWLSGGLSTESNSRSWRVWLARGASQYVSVSVVAFLIAMPMVAYHFGLVTPWAGVVSVAALPVVTGLLCVGYLKIVVGLVLPSVGVLLAGVLGWFADVMIWMVGFAAVWPGAWFELSVQSTAGWCVAATGVAVAWMGGWFVGRRLALSVAVGLCVVTVCVPGQMVRAVRRWVGSEDAAVRVNMFAVGDGSCYLVRLSGGTGGTGGTGGEGSEGRGYVLMFDCGSQADGEVGRRRIVPALKQLGVGWIDTLMISHADMDHFNGCLAVADRVGIGRVLVPSQLLEAGAGERSSGAAAFLVEQLRGRGLSVEGIGRGWREERGGGQLEVLWPAEGLKTRRVNDTSLVLSIRAAGRRVLLNGDIGQASITAMLDGGVDLRADVSDLPHHGSVVGASGRWLEAVGAGVVLQSSGRGRLMRDKWAGLLDGLGVTRLVTAQAGMVCVTIGRAGSVGWTTFLDSKR